MIKNGIFFSFFWYSTTLPKPPCFVHSTCYHGVWSRATHASPTTAIIWHSSHSGVSQRRCS